MKTVAIGDSIDDAMPSGETAFRTTVILSRALTYAALILWAFVCLFPIYWTVSTSMKTAVDVTQGHLLPWLDFQPAWKGWRSLGLSPDTIFDTSTVRDEFVSRFTNSVITSFSSSLRILISSFVV